jgi:hypothetical protein
VVIGADQRLGLVMARMQQHPILPDNLAALNPFDIFGIFHDEGWHDVPRLPLRVTCERFSVSNGSNLLVIQAHIFSEKLERLNGLVAWPRDQQPEQHRAHPNHGPNNPSAARPALLLSHGLHDLPQLHCVARKNFLQRDRELVHSNTRETLKHHPQLLQHGDFVFGGVTAS